MTTTAAAAAGDVARLAEIRGVVHSDVTVLALRWAQFVGNDANVAVRYSHLPPLAGTKPRGWPYDLAPSDQAARFISQAESRSRLLYRFSRQQAYRLAVETFQRHRFKHGGTQRRLTALATSMKVPDPLPEHTYRQIAAGRPVFERQLRNALNELDDFERRIGRRLPRGSLVSDTLATAAALAHLELVLWAYEYCISHNGMTGLSVKTNPLLEVMRAAKSPVVVLEFKDVAEHAPTVARACAAAVGARDYHLWLKQQFRQTHELRSAAVVALVDAVLVEPLDAALQELRTPALPAPRDALESQFGLVQRVAQ